MKFFKRQYTTCLISLLKKNTLSPNTSEIEVAGPQTQTYRGYKEKFRAV